VLDTLAEIQERHKAVKDLEQVRGGGALRSLGVGEWWAVAVRAGGSRADTSCPATTCLLQGLLELHQIFLDMAVLVEAQGEMLDNIEKQVGSCLDGGLQRASSRGVAAVGSRRSPAAAPAPLMADPSTFCLRWGSPVAGGSSIHSLLLALRSGSLMTSAPPPPQVARSVDHVQSGAVQLKEAKQLQRNTRKWMCCGIITLIVLLVAIGVGVAAYVCLNTNACKASSAPAPAPAAATSPVVASPDITVTVDTSPAPAGRKLLMMW